MKIFDLYKENLDGTKLIEASAGTGKTFTLSGLYIRYIVEKQLLPENILVLTFTKAATAELKTRLRDQLIECKNHLLDLTPIKSDDNPQLFAMYEGYKSNESALKYIEMSLICFDQAAIYTINGFCQKVIDDYNSDCGSPVFQELINTKEYVKKFVYEFWRMQQKGTPKEFLTLIPGIDDVIKKIDGLLNKSHYQQVKPEIDWNNNDLYQQLKILRQSWNECQDRVLDYMFSGCFGRKFSKAAYEKCRSAMNGFIESFTIPSTNFVERFKQDYLESERTKESTIESPEYLIQFQNFYNTLIYSYGDGKTSGNNLAISYMYECFNYVQQKLDDLLTQQGMYNYSDQIKVVHNGVKSNPSLVGRIANQWQCVMVDEFQDTDNMQLEIFDHCFNGGKHDLIYVGDPKQAIYDFRGADVFVYNQAKGQTQQQFNLATNWRSSDKILSASNAMFNFENSFKFPWLQFTPSKPKPDQQKQLQDTYAPVALIDCPEQDRKALLGNEINRFLNQASINQTAIKPENCAILVNSNKEAIALYEYLLSVDISVSLWSDSGVFATDCAKQLYYLIRAINYPSTNNIFTTQHGMFFDVSLNDLQKLDTEEYVAEFVDYRLESHLNNIVSVIEDLFDKKDVYARLLQRLDGERHYTDLQHLLELLQQQVDLGHNANQLEQWLAVQIQQVEFLQEDDERKRRIESDGKKISIMTIHKSKGLEFDHIFIPYADKIKQTTPRSNINLRACLATHDENNVGKVYWKHSKTAAASHELERRAEKIRNLYVAITRARHRVYIGLDSQATAYKSLPITQLIKQIENDGNHFSVVNHTEVSSEKPIKISTILSKPDEFRRLLDKPQSIYSFSALSKRQHVSYEKLEAEQIEIDFSNYFQFPKGSKSGTMQHEILENLDFQVTIPEIQTEVVSQLIRNHYDNQWTDCLTQQIDKILNTQLWKNGPQLSQITNSVDEMEFMLPIESIDKSTISQWLARHRNRPTDFNQDNLKGFLTGFIDLIFEHDNKYYVVDYKSNYLGSDFSDYSSDNLKIAIEHHYYDLQYLLYCVALIKYLQITLDGFDYKSHFGGVAYLFTRGVNGIAGQGVYTNQPEQELIEQMIGEFHGK